MPVATMPVTAISGTNSVALDYPAKMEERLAFLESPIEELEERMPKEKVTMVVFSGEMDRVFAASKYDW